MIVSCVQTLDYPRQYFQISEVDVTGDPTPYAGWVVPYAGSPGYYYWWFPAGWNERSRGTEKPESELLAELMRGGFCRTVRDGIDIAPIHESRKRKT